MTDTDIRILWHVAAGLVSLVCSVVLAVLLRRGS